MFERGSPSAREAWSGLHADGFFQSPELGDLYVGTTRHKVLRFVTGDEGSPTGYAQVIVFREGPAMLGSVGAHGTIRHGPVMKPEARETDLTALLGDIVRATRGALAYLRVYPGRKPLPSATFSRQGFERQSWRNFYIDLERPERSILNGMRKERRYGIRKAAEHGVVVSTVESPADVAEVYA